MAKAVFTAKPDSIYDDDLERRYHFPRTYLNQVESAVGDLAVYYEPRRQGVGDAGSGRRAYFAVVEVVGCEGDRQRANHYYAHVRNLLRFDREVPFRVEEIFFESSLRKSDGSVNRGAFGRAVRLVPEVEFEAILAYGMAETSRVLREAPVTIPGLQEPPDTFERPIVQQILNRRFRDAAFARQVREAYDARCAMTGLRILNGGGRPEIEAAHIKPVADNGPDALGNGIALCRTAHWMFDRGLVTLGANDDFLVATKHVSDDMRRLLRQDGKLMLPVRTEARPHPKFAAWHREFRFKGV